MFTNSFTRSLFCAPSKVTMASSSSLLVVCEKEENEKLKRNTVSSTNFNFMLIGFYFELSKVSLLRNGTSPGDKIMIKQVNHSQQQPHVTNLHLSCAKPYLN